VPEPSQAPRPRGHNAHKLTCPRFGLFPVRSPLLRESRLMSFPPGTEMVHFPGFASPPYGFRRRYPVFNGVGFPIRRSPDQSLFNDSPGLIAAGHVLHRLSAPRHPLHALSNLTIKFGQDKTCRNSIVKDRIYRPPPETPEDDRVMIMPVKRFGGADRDRTGDLRLAKPALSRLSYSPPSMEKPCAGAVRAPPLA
jgi:hypothetical protein